VKVIKDLIFCVRLILNSFSVKSTKQTQKSVNVYLMQER